MMSNETIYLKTKVCKKCGKEKDISEFSYKGRINADGTKARRSKCKDCISKSDAVYREKKRAVTGELAKALLSVVNYDPTRLAEITEDAFQNKVSVCGTYSFEEIRKSAFLILESKGLLEESTKELFADGNYLVVGDSFGKHCPSKMFDLFDLICERLDIRKIIHVGHILDDTDQMSNRWEDVADKLIVVGKPEELPTLYQYKKDYGFDVVLNYVSLGRPMQPETLYIKNQETISPYSKTSVRTLDPYIYRGRYIVNSTRHEYFSRSGGYDDYGMIASPGTIAKPHVRKTSKQIDFTDGYKVKEAFTSSFSRYRRMQELTEYWQNGLILVEVRDGIPFVHPIRIKEAYKDYFTVYAGNIFDTRGVVGKVYTSLVVADIHLPNHCPNSLSVLFSYAGSKHFDDIIVVGDLMDNRAMNPHEPIFGVKGDALEELKYASAFLRSINNDSKDMFVLGGNHDEGFTTRYTAKIPALRNLMDRVFSNCMKSSGVTSYVTEREAVDFGSVVYHHGSDKMFGMGNGNVLEKYAKVFTTSTRVIGHVHYHGMTRDTYSLPCLCKLDQGYNSTLCSNWQQGFAVVHLYQGEAFVDVVSFISDDYSVKYSYGDFFGEVSESMDFLAEKVANSDITF